MCFSRTEFALCFPYKLLTLSTGNTVIFNSTLAIPSGVLLPHWDGLSIFPEVIPDSPLSSFQWWQRLLPLSAATRAACELCGIPQEQEDSSIPCSPACLTGMNFPDALCTRYRKITQGCSTWGKDLEHNIPWLQPDHPGVQETNPSHIIAPKSKTVWSWFHHKAPSPCSGK